MTTVTASWIERARRVTPGGVHSPVRAFKAMSSAPLAIVEARGAHVFDQSGRRFIDWIGAWGPALLGHALPGTTGLYVHADRATLRKAMEDLWGDFEAE